MDIDNLRVINSIGGRENQKSGVFER